MVILNYVICLGNAGAVAQRSFTNCTAWKMERYSPNPGKYGPEETPYLYSFHAVLAPANICLFNVSNKNTRKKSKICSKITVKIPERLHWCAILVFLLLTLNIFRTIFSVSVVDFEQTNCWGSIKKFPGIFFRIVTAFKNLAPLCKAPWKVASINIAQALIYLC